MKFPSELRQRFECLGLDPDEFYSTPIRKCFRIHQPVKDLDLFEPIPWAPDHYRDQVKNAWRIYPEDFSTNGFFVAKIRKLVVSR